MFEPLTLLDCLHTFCGSCLADWFRWQLIAAENSPNPPSPGSKIFTCPSCRAFVRDTKHNATVATLLEMFLTANPDKAKPEEEKEEMRQKYKRGDNVLPKIRMQDKSRGERRLEEMERRMLEQAREMSLREAGVETSLESRRARRRRDQSTSEDTRGRLDREGSRDPQHRDSRDRSQRADDRRRRPEAYLEERRRQRSMSRNQSRDSSQNRRRHVEHQASIRSLISSSDIDSRDLEREIEDFARHIQEEGLLDGLNLDNIDELSRNDELSRKITEAYRRRQRERSRQEQSRRQNGSPTSYQSESAQSIPRSSLGDASRPSSRQRSNSVNTRPANSTSQWEDRSRPPVTSTHLDVRSSNERRPRRRTSSGGRSTTDPIRPNVTDSRPAARSQTDLTLPPQRDEPRIHRPSVSESRSTSMPTTNSATQSPVENSTDRGLPFSARATASQNGTVRATESSEATSHSRTRRNRRPSDVVVPQAPLPSLGLLPSSAPAQHHRARTQYYQEPLISCSRCGRSHIEYELHYNCAACREGNWNLCLSCYRAGKGCLHWFGFGYTAFKKWERARIGRDEDLEPPHMLTSNCYNPPKHTPGGADGRRMFTTDDPALRLESGSFCSRCFEWANECFWRCDVCNEGDWGFCNKCVNQGYCCTHPLLPLAYVAPPQSQAGPHTPPSSPRSPGRPPSAALLTGPNVVGIGNFKPLTFTTTCDVCHSPIPPAQHRYHCSTCVSRVVPGTLPGDYDVCAACYARLEVQDKRISPENGSAGWRRCLRGHRMIVVGFDEGRGGQRRRVFRDVVGGVGLCMEPYDGPKSNSNLDDSRGSGVGGTVLQKWSWKGAADQPRLERLVTLDVAATAPRPSATTTTATGTGTGMWTDQFPPEGGAGMRAQARWSWYPQAAAADELLFPRGAEVREIEDINGDWFLGSYMGAEGLFPSPYVRVIAGEP